MSRRKFIQHAGLLAGGLVLNNQLVHAIGNSTNYAKIKVGVIGCGDRGRGLMMVMKQLPELFEIRAICDVLDFQLENAGKIVKDQPVKSFKDYRSLLDDSSIQAIVIATPLHLHYVMSVAALAAGKHVFQEKTMTYSIEEALDLVSKVKLHPRQIFQVGHQYRYVPLYYRVKEMIDKGYLGKVTQIDCRWDRNASWRRPVPPGYSDRQINWRMYKEYSGGLVAELLSHQIDFINWAFNTHPDEVLGTGGIDFYKDGRETYDNVQVLLRYNKAGMIGNFGATCANSREGYIFKIKGTKGTVELLVNEGVFYPEPATRKELGVVDGVTSASKIEWNKDGGIPILKEKMKDGTMFALQDFHKSITQQVPPASNVQTGATTAISVHMSNSAIYNNRMEEWKEEYDV
ncbi:Gfo/Idh/MocA family protein [Flavihumibacter sp. UBA7668]|uniref:Gfo/Idh/MocA family protein n=1 Tax=Flavihumibacter sp. UBA7668 TaxID=1946542 RepID=UPI0025C6EC9B|nr:Gfo/Idh/MocA family oxidoreductase [Flavihumibacter sp. UBA7668]